MNQYHTAGESPCDGSYARVNNISSEALKNISASSSACSSGSESVEISSMMNYDCRFYLF